MGFQCFSSITPLSSQLQLLISGPTTAGRWSQTMISVTVAANGRSRRYVGAHLKAYGSGRLSIAELDYDPSNVRRGNESGWSRFFWKFIHIMVNIFKMCFPFFASKRERKLYRKLTQRTSVVQAPSPIQNLDEAALLEIFKRLDGKTVQNCASVNKKWRKTILRNRAELPKVELDQVRVLFDEGEIVLYPRDEKKTPVRHQIPPLKLMEKRLRHFNTDSLLVRGLIPVEAIPVLKTLIFMQLTPKQIYFIWCRFHQDSVQLLHSLLNNDDSALVDLGLEDCSPTHLFTDDLIHEIVPGLNSLRIWSDGRSGTHAIGDKTIYLFCNSIKSGKAVDSIDLSSCNVSMGALRSLVQVWIQYATADMSISISKSTLLDTNAVVDELQFHGIYFEDGYIRSGSHRMTLFC